MYYDKLLYYSLHILCMPMKLTLYNCLILSYTISLFYKTDCIIRNLYPTKLTYCATADSLRAYYFIKQCPGIFLQLASDCCQRNNKYLTYSSTLKILDCVMCVPPSIESVNGSKLTSCENFENVIKTVNNNNEVLSSKTNSVSKMDMKFYVGPEAINDDGVPSSYDIISVIDDGCNNKVNNGFKKSTSFPGFGKGSFIKDVPEGFYRTLTNEELDKIFDSKKQEPLKSWKLKTKEYAAKYKSTKTRNVTINPWYKEFFLHSQPAHIIVTVAFLYLAFRLFPDSKRSQTEASTMTRLLYVLSVSAVSGTQFWMTFISGIALFLTVSRHTFGKVQLVLFPLYFFVNSVLTLIVIITYTQHNPTYLWDAHQLLQGVLLVTSFATNLVIRVYLSPVLTKLIKIKMTIEEEAGLGAEVGSSHPGVLENCPHYMMLYRAFRGTHVIIAGGNMVSVAATTLHLYYIATKLCSVHL